MLVDELRIAFVRLLDKNANNLLALTRQTGVNNSTLNRLNSKKADFENIPAKTIQRLFPEMKVFFFREDWPDGVVRVDGPNNAPIANGSNAQALVQYGRNAHAQTGVTELSGTDSVPDESTRILLAYWKDLPQSRRFEFLMKLAQIKEDATAKKV